MARNHRVEQHRSLRYRPHPQRWLPYRYLGPFVRDRWDVCAAVAISHLFPRGPRSPRDGACQ
jgi:hypothetical protein